MFRFTTLALLGFSLCCASQVAVANDSTASLGAGGLVLEKSDEIAILSEKLLLSPRRIVVDYEMKNISSKKVETLIAFPLPPLEAPMIINVPVEPQTKDVDNFLGFKTQVDGVWVTPERQIKAFQLTEGGDKGREVTEELRAVGALVSPLEEDYYDRMRGLPEETLRKLAEAKLADVHDNQGELDVTPLWVVEYTYFSKQTFEPGKVVKIHHEYAPVAGVGLFGESSFEYDKKDWCIDEPTTRAVRALIAKQARAAKDNPYIKRTQVDYILKTGANWAGPIKHFELTIEKENPQQIVSVCLDGLKRVSDTQFTVSRKEFTPDKDLSVLFLSLWK